MQERNRRFKDVGLDGKRARQYDEFSRKYRMPDFREYAMLAARNVADGASVLDVATGPGYFCIELAKLGDYIVTGLDISAGIVEIARANALKADESVEFIQGNASAMPFPDASFDLVFCAWAIKNFLSPKVVFAEMCRLLKPGGTALIVDLNREATGRNWAEYAAEHDLKGIASFWMRIAFLIQRRQAYSLREFETLLTGVPFKKPEIRSVGINLHIILRK